MEKRPSKMMVNHLNLILEKEGTCLRYIKRDTDCCLVTYALEVVDKYIDNTYYNCPSITKEFEERVRNFFKEYGVVNTGFSNTVLTIFVDK